jgi:glycosyltransferase involved in cell wall biosynthesis
MKKVITIGLPVFNGGSDVGAAINSLLRQSYKNFELIISDNGSSDATEMICRGFAALDDRIRYIRHPQNRGGLANFQDLLEAAIGDYFMWAAHDDIWSENYLAEALDLLEDTKFDFVFPRFELRSIKFNFYVKRDMKIFEFVEHENVDSRVIPFINLHTSSHKCNIVYSFFRTEFIRRAFAIQNIVNDGLLGVVILKLGRGKMMRGSLFSKRYRILWPGALDWIRRFIPQKNTIIFDEYKNRGELEALLLFPEYEEQIRAASSKFRPYIYKKNFQI